MNIEVVIEQMIQIFLMLFLGYFLYLIKLIDDEFIKKLTSFIVKVTMPALILGSVLGGNAVQDKEKVFLMLTTSFVIQFVMPVIAGLIVIVLHISKQQAGTYLFATTFSNVAFMGFPVIQALYGDEAVFYAALFNLAFNVVLFLFGAPLITYGTNRNFKIELKKFFSPGLVCSVLALILYLAEINLPSAICDTCNSVGGTTTPLAMILIGANLAKVKLKNLFNKWVIYPYTLIKQIVLPIAIWFILKQFITDDMILGVLVVLVSMPVANNAVLFATEYKTDQELASCLVFITTILSIATIPLIGYICF